MAELVIDDCRNEWSEELESLPLSARLKLLRSRKQSSDSEFLKRTVACRQFESVTSSSPEEEENGFFSSEEENMLPGENLKEVFLDGKRLDSPCFQASDCSLNNVSSPSSSGLCVVSHGDGSYEGNGATSSLSSDELVCNDRSPGSDFTVSTLQHISSVSMQGTKAKHEFSGDFDEALENVVLRERRKILLSRLSANSQKPCIQEIIKSKALPFKVQVKREPFLSDEVDDRGNDAMENSTDGVITLKRNLGDVDGSVEDDCGHLPLTDRVKLSPTRTYSSVSRDLNYQNKSAPSTAKLGTDCLDSESNDPEPSSSTDPRPSDRQEKGLNVAKSASSLLDSISVKIETFLSNEFDNEDKACQGLALSPNLEPVKTEGTNSLEDSDDELDHMSLLDRLMLLSKETSPSSDFKNLRTRGFGRGVLESVDSITVTRPRKRRRTATNSAETALEEDIPGLLKVLIGNGVSVEDIKLYGEPECDEAIDETFCEGSFTELEAVIGKVSSYREPLLKVTPICCSKGSNVTYCLGCLLSLVEQARFLRSRKWPVEWGWARDLQAFIFVFERHNRIVLERPEYGYATYFFEMLDSVPTGWHIRRLVIAMKLTGCGRISLLENRPLKVGEDLTEGEARVLAQYGWVPDTGLATMLNYYGRVVHDTNKERDGNEWRQKIGKILEDGYNGGRVVPRFRAKKEMSVEKDWLQSNSEVKLEI